MPLGENSRFGIEEDVVDAGSQHEIARGGERSGVEPLDGKDETAGPVLSDCPPVLAVTPTRPSPGRSGRAYYATIHKQRLGVLPDLHANPDVTARVYDRNREVMRSAL